MITIRKFIFNELEVNSFVLFDEAKECIIVDPACNSEAQRRELYNFIDGNQLRPVYIINTHGHFDHIFANSWAKSTYQCPLLIHQNDLPLLEQADKYGGMFGFEVSISPMPDRFLSHGEKIRFGNSELEILHVPGHSPGSVVLYAREDKFIIGGDVLFKGSIGRTDLPGGDYNLLIRGIREKLMALPRDTVVWPGHGAKTTIGHEYDTNPFLK